MYQPGILKLHIFADAFAVKTRENCGRCRSVETLVVIKNPNFQLVSLLWFPL
jgi:hypothetical protein